MKIALAVRAAVGLLFEIKEGAGRGRGLLVDFLRDGGLLFFGRFLGGYDLPLVLVVFHDGLLHPFLRSQASLSRLSRGS